MQKAQTRGGDREYTVPSTHFQTAFSELSDVHLQRRSGPQLGQLSLHKLLKLSRELNSVGSERCRRTSDAAAGPCNKRVDGAKFAGLAMHTHVPPYRTQQIQRTQQDLSVAPGKHKLDRLSCQSALAQPLPACLPTMQTASANVRLQTPLATGTEAFQQARCIQVTSHATEPVQKRSCKLHRSPSMRPTSVGSEHILSKGSATAAVLLAHHCKRLMSADPSSPPLCSGHPSDKGGNPPLPSCRDTFIHLPQTHSMQPVQTACNSFHNTTPPPPVRSLQPVQLPSTAPHSESNQLLLTAARLHKHDAAELPSKQESDVPSHVSDEDLGLDNSASSSFFTDTADSAQISCFLPDLVSSGLDRDDCLSISTSQGITDGSSSMGDVDAAEGSSLRADTSNRGRASSLAEWLSHASGVAEGCPAPTFCFPCQKGQQ